MVLGRTESLETGWYFYLDCCDYGGRGFTIAVLNSEGKTSHTRKELIMCVTMGRSLSKRSTNKAVQMVSSEQVCGIDFRMTFLTCSSDTGERDSPTDVVYLSSWLRNTGVYHKSGSSWIDFTLLRKYSENTPGSWSEGVRGTDLPRPTSLLMTLYTCLLLVLSVIYEDSYFDFAPCVMPETRFFPLPITVVCLRWDRSSVTSFLPYVVVVWQHAVLHWR